MLRVEAMLIRTSPPPLLRLSVVLSKPVGTGGGLLYYEGVYLN